MVTPIDLTVTIGKKTLPNPVGVASGTFGYGGEYETLMDVSRLGAIYTKAVTLAPRFLAAAMMMAAQHLSCRRCRLTDPALLTWVSRDPTPSRARSWAASPDLERPGPATGYAATPDRANHGNIATRTTS